MRRSISLRMLAHAAMEPPAALAIYRDGKVEAWAPTQNPQGAQDAIAAAVGAKKEDVTVNVTLLGGGFGRKSFPDFAVEAAVLSKKTGKPVKVVWSREDDIKFDSFHSVAAMYFKASLGPGWQTASMAATQRLSSDCFHLRRIGTVCRCWGNWPRLQRSSLRAAEPTRGKRAGTRAHAHRMAPLRRQYLSCLRDSLVCRGIGRRGGKRSRGICAGAAGAGPHLAQVRACRRITPITMATTSNIPSTSRDSAGWCRWRRKNPAGANKKFGNGFGMGDRYSPQLPDLCRDRRTSRGERHASDTFAASIPRSTPAPIVNPTIVATVRRRRGHGHKHRLLRRDFRHQWGDRPV